MESISDDQKFLEFYYPQVKDLCKHFLTLISATVVFAITFSEKIVDLTKAPILQKGMLVTSLFLMIVALALCGFGLYMIFMAAEQASGGIIVKYGSDFKVIARRSYNLLDLSGIAYGLALVVLAITAATRLFSG